MNLDVSNEPFCVVAQFALMHPLNFAFDVKGGATALKTEDD